MKYFFLFLAFFISQKTFSQNKKKLDSLQNVYKNAKHDTTRILTLTYIASEYRNDKPDTCISIAEKVLEISEKIDFEKGKANAYYCMGLGNQLKKNYKEAILYYEKALPIFEKLKFNKNTENCLKNIGRLYLNQNDYSPALENYQKCLKLCEKKNDKSGILECLYYISHIYYQQNNYTSALESQFKELKIIEELGEKNKLSITFADIGSTYDAQGNFPMALEYYFKAKKIADSRNDKSTNMRILANIGHIQYNQGELDLSLENYQKYLKLLEENNYKDDIPYCLNAIGCIYFDQNKQDLALTYFEKTIKLAEEAGDKKMVAYSLNNIARLHNKQKNYPLATDFYEKSLKIAEKEKDKYGISYSLNGLAEVAQNQKNYEKSIEYAQKSLQIVSEMKMPLQIGRISNTLYKSYKLNKNYEKALEYYELHKLMNDSLFSVDNTKKIANIQKQSEIEILNKNKELAQKEKEALEKDLKLQNIEAERQKNANLALEKQAEADRLLNLALHEKDQRKQDSLRSLAQKNQLEADNFKAKGLQLKAEAQARETEVLKQKEAKEFQQYINYLVVVGLLSVAVFAFFIFKSRQKEIKAKEAIAEQKEEILQMNEELNTTLNAVEIERQKSDKLLLNILPQEVAHELKETGKTDVRYFESVTVLFADVKGFSALATKISPQALIAELDTTFSKMDEISNRFGLERIKTIGDCYMACGGLPNANKTHPFDVVLTALNIQNWMNEERKKNPDFWQVRLGLHTGDAVAGVIGKTKFAYDIWGNTVNLASRMESGGEVGKVNVTEQTFEIVKDYFEGDYRAEIEAKNIGKVKAYFITRLKPEYAKDELGFEPNEKFNEIIKSL